VTTSLICRTLVLDGFFFNDWVRAFKAASQSKTEWTERALYGDRTGESTLPTDGLCGTLRLGKVCGPAGGADIGTVAGLKGLGGMMGAVARGKILSPSSLVGGVDWPSLQEQSDCSLVAVLGIEADSGVVWPEGERGEFKDIALERKSV
jgi:hypothetical protein